jgi:putative ABC transport system permease protein
MSLPLPDLFMMAWKSLSSQWLRSSLTTFGVFMGVSAVSATLNIQAITQTQIDQKLAERDQPFVSPSVWSEHSNPEVGEEDVRVLKQTIPFIRAVSIVGSVYISSVQFENNQVDDLDTQSVSLNYLETTGRKILQGRLFNQTDLDQYRPVAIVDDQLATNLFEDKNAINQAIYAAGMRLIVIGVVEAKLNNPNFARQGTLWVTENFAKVLQNGWSWRYLQISPYRLTDMEELETQVEEVLSNRYPDATIYTWDNAKDLLKEQETQQIAARALTGVGLIALVIGGVGIANITVAAVMERTKEIGIRRAIGASQLEIMSQFILEAVALSLLGGIAAILTVHGLTKVVTTVVVQIPYEFSVRDAMISMGSALLVGVCSSFFPALRATQVDIVKALRGN